MPEIEKENLVDERNGATSPTQGSHGHTTIMDSLMAKSSPSSIAMTPATINHSNDLYMTENLILKSKNIDDKSKMTNRFKNHKIDRFLAPSPFPYQNQAATGQTESEPEVEYNNSGDSFEKRFNDSSDSTSSWKFDSSRPHTAPPHSYRSHRNDDKTNLRTSSVPILASERNFRSANQVQESDISIECNNNEICRSDLQLTCKTTKTWHPHVYGKPPKRPTPHSIDDILGLPALTISTGRSSNKVRSSSFSKGQSRRMESMSSVSDNEDNISTISDQPLNLSVAKSRDVSPLLPDEGSIKQQLITSKLGKLLYS